MVEIAADILAGERPLVLGDGQVTLWCGDCLRILPTFSGIDVLLTDPPYSSGGAFRGDRMGKTSTKYQSTEHRDIYFEFSGDNRDQRAFGYWSALWGSASRTASKQGSLCIIFTDWRQLPTTTDAIQSGGWIWRGIVAWDKTEASRPQKGRFRNQAEYVFWGSNGPLLEDGPCAPGVFRYSVNCEEKHHIAGKPTALLADLLQLSPDRSLVADPLMGSGTTGVAAVRLGRRFAGIEIEPRYFEIAARRIQAELDQPRLELAPAAKPVQAGLFEGPAA